MSATNHALARVLYQIASIYKYLGSEQRFRAAAYSKAARVIDGLKEDISTYVKNDTLEQIPGIGESIAQKIIEFTNTGRIKKYDELKKSIPTELIELMNVSGFGPESVRQIHEQLKINTRAQLIKALQEGTISRLKGFGNKKTSNMIRGLKLYKQTENRMLLATALELGERIKNELKKNPEILNIELAGSLRRKKESIGDIDLLVSCLPKNRKKVVNEFLMLSNRNTILSKGDTKASILISETGIQVDLRIVNENEWGAALLYFTGSKEHNIQLRTIAKNKGLKINEYGLYNLKDENSIAGSTEEEIYHALGFQWIPPQLREDQGEIELASKNKIPKLITLNDIKGDLQMHSTWSDGSLNIEELAKHVLKNFDYEYIVLTDHSKSERIAGGMDENQFLKQIAEIKSINNKIGRDFIKAGAEVDILADGTLDLKDELLMQLDWVCASIHSGFKKDNTNRLIKACWNPYVNCIGHPSGRLIGKRDEYKVDWVQLFKTASATGTTLEINSQPERMDLNDQLAHEAIKAGVLLTISTDSHNADNFSFMKYGVYIAQRAYCTKNNILNTKSWNELHKFVQHKRLKLKG